MPELAEVEYVTRQLRESVVGAHIASVAINWLGIVSRPTPEDFVHELTGRTITAIDRRAKIMLIHVSGDGVLTVHRRMAGNVSLVGPTEPDEPYLCATFNLADGRRLLYSDPRKFGRLAFWSEAELPAALAHLGPEPLEPAFTATRLAAIVQGRGRAIKALLLDQTAIAGIGNIYADESLFNAGIHPARAANSLTDAEITRLHTGIVTALTVGIDHGGTTFGRHRDLFGEAGTNVAHLNAYQRTGAPCRRCGTPLVRIVLAQRGTHFCPHCQPPPQHDSGASLS